MFIAGSGIGEMVIPVVTGYLFENFSSLWLMYIVLSFSALVTVVFTCLQCIASRCPVPASASKLGFIPLHDEEENSIAMNTFDLDDHDYETPNGSTGYAESIRFRQMTNNHIEDAEEETTKLVDFSD